MYMLKFIFNWVLPIYVVYLVYVNWVVPYNEANNVTTEQKIVELSVEEQQSVNFENNLFHKNLLELGNISFYEFNLFYKRTKLCELLKKSIEDNMNTKKDVYYLREATGWWFSTYLKATTDNKASDYLYIGKLKDEKPDGDGVLLLKSEGEWFVSYVGEFDEGQKDGYGIEFMINSKFYSYGIERSSFISFGETVQIRDIMFANIDDMTSEQILEYSLYYSSNYPYYEGDYSKNKQDGKGNAFYLSILQDLSTIEDFDYDYDIYGDFDYSKIDAYYGICAGKVKCEKDEVVSEEFEYIGRDKSFIEHILEVEKNLEAHY